MEDINEDEETKREKEKYLKERDRMINKKINYEEENKRKKLCREIYEEDLKNFMMRVIRIAVNEMEKK